MSTPTHGRRPVPRLRLAAAVAALLAAAAVAMWLFDRAGGFAQARERGVLRVGVPHVPDPVPPGGKVRTPERLDAELAARLAGDLGVRVAVLEVPPDLAARALAEGRVDVVLAPGPPQPGLAAVDTGYRSAPRPVMRSDTAIRSWSDMQGRTVCIAQAAWQARRQAQRSGAQVRAYRVPSDALVAVRSGLCDAGLIDEAMWRPLVAMPEWRKFSATLDVQSAEALYWLLPAPAGEDAGWLARRMRGWRGDGVYGELAAQWARNVAFDVYLDQEVPDCHG